jgi:hypothetical protein
MPSTAKHYDGLDTRSPGEREKALMQALSKQVRARQAECAVLGQVDEGRRFRFRHLALGAGEAAVLRKSMVGETQKEEAAPREARRGDILARCRV